jgi:hypothetical protein
MLNLNCEHVKTAGDTFDGNIDVNAASRSEWPLPDFGITNAAIGRAEGLTFEAVRMIVLRERCRKPPAERIQGEEDTR